MQKFKYHILLHTIIFIWGFTGILGVLISLDAIAIVWSRVLIAFLSLLIFLVIFDKSAIKTKSKKNRWLIISTGIVVALHWVTFYHSIKLSTASLGILCLSTTTIHVSWLEPLIMKRRFSWFELVLSSVVVVGIYIVSEDFNTNEYWALFFGLTSALLAATFAVLNAKLVNDESSKTITLWEMGAATIFLSFFLIGDTTIINSVIQMNLSDLLWLLFLGIVCTSFAFLVTIEVVKYLGAFTVSLSINLEPVYTIFLAIIILNENKELGVKFYIGAGIIIFVVMLNAVIKYFKKYSVDSKLMKTANNS